MPRGAELRRVERIAIRRRGMIEDDVNEPARTLASPRPPE